MRMSDEQKESMRDELLTHVAHLVLYWERESRTPDLHEKLSGLAFSILSALDGCAAALPGYHLIPLMEGVTYDDDVDNCDISHGGLHEQIHKYIEEQKK